MAGTGLVEVKADMKALTRVRLMLAGFPREIPGVVSRSINKTATGCRAEIARRIAAIAKIPQGATKKGIVIHKATRRFYQATLDITSRRIPLIEFRARQLKRGGVTYSIEKGGKRRKIIEAFISVMPSGHRGVYRRYRPTTPRLPIIQLFGPSIGSLFEGAGGIAKQVQAKSGVQLEKNLLSQIRYILEKKRKRG